MTFVNSNGLSLCRLSTAATVLAFVGLVPPLAAGPPLITDDPDTPGPRGWEINVAAELEKSGGAREFAVPVFDLNYGVGDMIQLKFEVPLILLDEPGRGLLSGLGKAEAGVKWRFLDEEQAGFSLSTYPQTGFDFSSSSTRRGLTEGGTELLLPFQAAKTFGPVLVFAEAGRLWRQDPPGEWIAGLAAEYQLTGSLSLLAEIHGVADEDFDDGTLLLNSGVKWKFHKRFALLASVGHSVRTPAGEPDIFISYLGLQWTLQTS